MPRPLAVCCASSPGELNAQDTLEGYTKRARAFTLANVYICLMDAVVMAHSSNGVCSEEGFKRVVGLQQALDQLKTIAKSLDLSTHAPGSCAPRWPSHTRAFMRRVVARWCRWQESRARWSWRRGWR